MPFYFTQLYQCGLQMSLTIYGYCFTHLLLAIGITFDSTLHMWVAIVSYYLWLLHCSPLTNDKYFILLHSTTVGLKCLILVVTFLHSKISNDNNASQTHTHTQMHARTHAQPHTHTHSSHIVRDESHDTRLELHTEHISTYGTHI